MTAITETDFQNNPMAKPILDSSLGQAISLSQKCRWNKLANQTMASQICLKLQFENILK